MSQLPAQAQFPINEPFTGSTAPSFTLGGKATLTGTTTTPGYLRLTDNTTNQAGYAILNGSFASPQGFSISFEFFTYGSTSVAPADGISVFLIDANGTDPKTAGQFVIGAYGGSLGYAQKTAASGSVTTDINGVTKGYLGIGLDEYGNFATSSEGRVGGYTTTTTTGTTNTTTLVPQSVTLRGPGTGTSNYQYLTSSGTLPFDLSVATTRAQAGTADYRKAYIYVVPSNGAYTVTVRIQHGTTVTTTTDSYPITTPPANLRIGFAASTGAYTDIHEIRNLAILNNPYAVDDAAITKYNTAVTLSVLSNDKGIGATINPATVDLDPSTPGIQSSYTVANQGTFTVNSQGVVTFTPVTGYAGLVTPIPYTVNDILGQTSNPANITIRVTGADVATSVSGPASASPGATVTYTVSTTNIGVEQATNISPTLQLPANLTIPASANYTYNTTSGLVTFSQTTLTSGAAVSNTISFAVPSSGTTSIATTAGYTYGTNFAVPDPVITNNTASLTTVVVGPVTVAAVCATPGKDGVGSLTTAGPNTYYSGTSVSAVTTAANTTVSVIGVSTIVGTTPVAAGDLVLVMQMQGATIDNGASSSTYGAVSASSSTAGQYEYAVVASVSGSPITSITLNRALTNTYSTGTNQNFQVIRVPQYSSLTINGILTGTAWNSQTKVGGVLALDVAGSTTFSGTAGLSMTAKGFAGGGGVSYGGNTINDQTLYATPTSVTAHGSKGEGIAGTPVNFYDGTTTIKTTGTGYPTGDNNRGAPANAGGGAQDFTPLTNAGNSGGGGGANLVAGGRGGNGFGSANAGTSFGIGGRGFTTGSASTLIMGGGGGAGSTDNGAATAYLSSGGIGGGIVIFRTGSVTGTATIQASGGAAPAAGGALAQGGGGGGAGGTILVMATSATGNNSLAGITTNAIGGSGGTVNTGNNRSPYGPGGGGSGGVVYANVAPQTVSVAAGAAGVTYLSNGGGTQSYSAAAGTAITSATNTANLSTSATATNTIGGAGSCIPTLAVELTTSTPNVTRSSSASAPNPASYTAIISNTGGTAPNTSTTLTMDPLFTLDSSSPVTVSLTAADGTTTTLAASAYTLAGAGTNAPVFSGITIPAGSTLKISYRATIAKAAVNGTVYQASGDVTFTDPTRTAANSTVTPSGSFASGGGTAPGSNYATTTSTLEDVTIVNPLPVELSRFEALAVRQDALLTWSTASEHNNDHFTIERSLTGSGFVAVGTVRGQGNSVTNTTYTFTDSNAGRLASTTVYYRLKQVDLDGTASYSPVRAVQFATAKAAASLYPNPSQGQIVLDLSGLAQGTYSVQVLDLTGRVLRAQQVGAQASPLDLSGLPQGAYLVLVQGAGVRQALPLLRN
ncbi:T9SS type A sorting domain-containing protein [Hymenobacter cheonanensis]|uniref:T9SS type A sorting domain-containing protein n=1 Tax=Hymenobacter sp. CA2-7 TaxID=3063993 RepID=UPI0027135D5A|nr:T9SS type A sorting domain-containing protein [Hymenobacter sp. CA2-7]MDO7884828.1 T9SS type A sorting domain-containing protein [Hymenobacter sp. CA2-7]